MAQHKKKHKKQLFFSGSNRKRTKAKYFHGKKREPQSRRITREMMAKAKKDGTTALDVLYELIKTKSQKVKDAQKGIHISRVHAIHENNINCHMQSDYMMYQAIKRYNNTDKAATGLHASYKKEVKKIVFTNLHGGKTIKTILESINAGVIDVRFFFFCIDILEQIRKIEPVSLLLSRTYA